MERLIGREKEIYALKSYLSSGKEEFVAVYGRRRVGKTFLIRNFFNDDFDFYATGIIGGTKSEELEVFNESLMKHGYMGERSTTWMGAFSNLASLIEDKSKTKDRVVVFIDELPCFDTHRSGFVKALDYFWNSKGSWIKNLFFVVCGSATSWMIRNIIDNKGGLHNRVTHEMHIAPFTLCETEQYLRSKEALWDRLSIAQLYMAVGGVPYYLSLLDIQQSVPENIDRLFFSKSAELKKEYKRLFKSLYKNARQYIEIVTLLAKHKSGMTRSEIAKALKIEGGGFLSDMLEDLVNCDFVLHFNNGQSVNNSIYRLVDFYILFYNQFCTKRSTDVHYWRNNIGTPIVNTWYGLAFERLCMYHIEEIKQALHLDAIHTEYYSWRSRNQTGKGAQIDLAIDRADNIVSICEIKYCVGEYTLDKEEYEKIINRRNAFVAENPRKGTQVVMITTFGIKPNKYPEIMKRGVVLDNLFEKLYDE